MRNTDIRALISKNGLYIYQVAEAMGVKAQTLSIYLMRPLTKPQKERIKEAIKTAKTEGLSKHGKKTI